MQKTQYVKIILLFLIAFSILFSCSNNNPVSDNPVSEGTLNIAVGGNFFNSNFQATILECELHFDGSQIASANFSQPNSLAMLTGTVISVKKGQHTISFKIIDQTSSPNIYETIGVNVVADNGSTYNLADGRKSLATGESISYTVDLP